MGKKGEKKKPNKGRFTFFFIVFLIVGAVFIVWLLPYFFGMEDLGNTALITIDGIVLTGGSASMFGSEITSSADIAAFIRDADEDPFIEAIVIEINSPGGSGVAAEEISEAISLTDKPTVAYIRDIGLSAGYWIASSTDYIIASRFSLVGSIGVISSYLEFSGLFEKYGITYQRLVAGEYKDIGSPFKKMTKEEERLFQEQLDHLHAVFIETVAQNRGMSYKEIEPLATGMYFVGDKALDSGLIDQVGTPAALDAYIEDLIGTPPMYVTYAPKKTLWDVIVGSMSTLAYHAGEGIGSSFVSKALQRSSIII